jgi:hypothetical protein
MSRLSLGLGVQTIRKVGGGGAAPSGIVAATAGNLNISFAYFDPATYIKVTNTEWQLYFGEGELARLSWNVYSPLAWNLDVNNGDVVATNPSVNPLIIPTTGWTYTIGTGPAVTITAA